MDVLLPCHCRCCCTLQELLRRTGLEDSDDEQAGTLCAKDMEAELFGADSDDDSGAAARAAAKRSRSEADGGPSSGSKGRLKRRAVEDEPAGVDVADEGNLFAEEEEAAGDVVGPASLFAEGLAYA